MTELKNKTNGGKSGDIIGIIFLVIIALIFLNDVFLIPKKSKDYFNSCVWFAFTVNTEFPSKIRDGFMNCVESEFSQQNARKCWISYSPDTINLYDLNQCPMDLYDGGLILFK